MLDLPSLVSPLPGPLSRRERVRAGLDMWLVDHGFIRDIYCNIHQITETVWRSAQPAPHHLRWAQRRGIKTVVNLRGRRDTCGSYILEREACHRLGLTLIDFPIRSRGPLERATLHAAAEMFDSLRYPVLFHCKSGADRAGIMATLYLFLHRGVPLREALGQLSLRYGHIRHARTGLSDFFFESYLLANDAEPIAFFDWVDTVYDPQTLDAAFTESRVARILVNNVLKRE
ncbi:MAG: sulfur transferase domain-containing protein [Azospirillaceae bacterium]|nr:sulfur transferase domain-containing protein [Azospirillaceae bacterium]